MLQIYPWDLWFQLDNFVLMRGRDYNCSSFSFGQQVRNAAVSRGIRIKIRVDDWDNFHVTVTERPSCRAS